MKVGLKQCKKNCFSSSYRMYGCYVTYQIEKELLELNGSSETKEMKEVLSSETKQDLLHRDIDRKK
ncbi:hypothetical protein Tco_0337929, partial [Tanacetum coccineum]